MRRTYRRATLVALAVALPLAIQRRWSTNPDPTAGAPLDLPEGTEVAIPTHDGGELAAWDMGPKDGPAVVCAHGWTADRRVWATVAGRLLDAGCRVVVYDERGHGGSRAGDDGYTIEAIGADVAAVLEALDLRDAVVAGHSMGGMAVQAFAIEHPGVVTERVRGLALVSTAGAEMQLVALEPQTLDLVGSPAASRVMGRPGLGPWLVRSTLGRRPALPALRATAASFAETPEETRRRFLEAMVVMDLRPGLPAVTAPTVVISGTWDTLVPHGRSRRTAERIPGARLVPVPRAGHQLPFETPDLVARELLALSAVGAP